MTVHVNRHTIGAAHQRIASYIRKTPVIEVAMEQASTPVVFKLELLQHAGSFKPRGAFANLTRLAVPEAGVTAASGGNHGAAVAYAARKLGHRARIFVPVGAPRAKIDRIRSYGADVVADGPHYADALANCEAYQKDSGAISIHAYDAPETLNGQGTLALELSGQAPHLDTVLVAVGGGGLIGGIAAWYAGETRVVAVEPEQSAALHAAIHAGELTGITPGGVAADSLGASKVGALMFPIAQSYVDSVVLVTDQDIRMAQGWLWDNLRLVAEPGGAAALAALLSGSYRPAQGERVGIIMCGANTDLHTFAEALALSGPG